MSEQSLDQKFKVLLDPIKDLAASWDIDIADSLTEYLEELESLNITVDGGHNINFASAALLIQGSTAVYSKKVEFLHQLVLQSLEQMTDKKNSTNSHQNKLNKNGKNTTIDDDRFLFGSDPSFLLLDDVLEEGSNIDLIVPEDADNNASFKGKGQRRRSSSRNSISGDYSRASMVLVHSVLQEDRGGSNNLRMVHILLTPHIIVSPPPLY